MELWIASVETEEINRANRFPYSGIITNPSLIAGQEVPWQDTVANLRNAGTGPIHLQVVANDRDEVLCQVERFQELLIPRPLIVKLPFTKPCVDVIPELRARGLRINVTTVCNLGQALLAAEWGADYISVYYARLLDAKVDANQLISDIRERYETENVKTKVLAASIRTHQHFVEIIDSGAHAAAVPVPVLEALFDDPVTVNSVDKFNADWSTVEEHTVP